MVFIPRTTKWAVTGHLYISNKLIRAISHKHLGPVTGTRDEIEARMALIFRVRGY